MPDGELGIGGCSAVELAHTYGTPLHVVDAARLAATAADFQRAFAEAYPGRVNAHYALKCNSVPGVVRLLRAAGLKAEVMSEFELELALRLGYPGSEVIVNGPCKPESLLRACIAAEVRFVIADSLAELASLDRLGAELGRPVDVLLRINPDFVPRGMNQGSATASRRGCAFGLDLVGGEADRALEWLAQSPWVRCHGLHLHIGTGVDQADDYQRALLRLGPFVERSRQRGLPISVLDVGGGFAARTSREMTQLELLIYQGISRMPAPKDPRRQPAFRDFAVAVADGMKTVFGRDLPELLLEPGRSIASSSQLLLLTVHAVKERPGAGSWLITDGGLGTVTMPTFYEYHELLLANDPHRARTAKVTITGPVCFSGDIVYRNKLMPRVEPGEVLAVMDSGAYFTALESSFGFPRPAIVVVRDGRHRLTRRRETFADMTLRDDLGD
jgi:diaminopimelate decarboxylase